jgi:predicted GIY-YIG superfamily endonuclease
MPIVSQWWTFSEMMVQHDRDEPGVYELGETNGTVIYIGGSDAIRRRLREHLSESATTCTRRSTAQYRVEYTRNWTTRERQLHDEHVRLYGRPPRCNEVHP